jgi:glycosyltransferase involved in cell wall biosynthesis
MHKELNLDNKVQFLGHIDGLEKQLLLAKAYFVFMPSYSENFGISAVEALSQGTPVVASINTPWESLNHYEAGYWINNSPEILTDIIEKIVAMPLERHFEYSQNALKLVHKELDIFNNINIWIDSYNSINS